MSDRGRGQPRGRRPPRAWIGAPLKVDPEELSGPRGLTEEVLNDASLLGDSPAPPESDSIAAPRHDWRFYWSLLTDERKARIESVVQARLHSVTVVLDRLLDPHNTAAVLRTSEGLGLSTVHIVPHEGHDAQAHRRVTQDAHKWLDVRQHESGAAAAQKLAAQGYQVWAGHLDANAVLYTELPADQKIALLFGNEHDGPQPETLKACSGTFRIPMAGFTQSFNVSVAAGIALAHQTRVRRAFLNAAGDLPPDERQKLQERFTLLAARLARRMKS